MFLCLSQKAPLTLLFFSLKRWWIRVMIRRLSEKVRLTLFFLPLSLTKTELKKIYLLSAVGILGLFRKMGAPGSSSPTEKKSALASSMRCRRRWRRRSWTIATIAKINIIIIAIDPRIRAILTPFDAGESFWHVQTSHSGL